MLFGLSHRIVSVKKRKDRSVVSPAMVVAIIAMILSLPGAALAGRALIDTNDIKNGAVTSQKIAAAAKPQLRGALAYALVTGCPGYSGSGGSDCPGGAELSMNQGFAGVVTHRYTDASPGGSNTAALFCISVNKDIRPLVFSQNGAQKRPVIAHYDSFEIEGSHSMPVIPTLYNQTGTKFGSAMGVSLSSIPDTSKTSPWYYSQNDITDKCAYPTVPVVATSVYDYPAAWDSNFYVVIP